MANLTKAQLVDELIRLRAHSDRIEVELAKSQERGALLAQQLERAVGQQFTRGYVRPAYMDAAAKRRALSQHYFRVYPNERSVTDAQLAAFEADHETA